MPRFETTAATYAAHREPYPPAFFKTAAQTLALSGREALIDLGTGPGLLALGFAPYVKRIQGVDPEPAMVAAARQAAEAAGVSFPILRGRAEDVGADLGSFDLIAIGRALHWMEREPTLAAFDRLLAPGGRLLLCGSRITEANPWRSTFQHVLRKWSGDAEVRMRRAYQGFFEGTRFAPAGDVTVEHRQEITPRALVERALTRSTTSPAVLGDRIDEFRAELTTALAPYFPNGAGEEIVEAKAQIFAAARYGLRGVGQVSLSR